MPGDPPDRQACKRPSPSGGGTSLSGQAITDGVLVLDRRGFCQHRNRLRRNRGAPGTRHHRREANRRLARLRPQDRSRSLRRSTPQDWRHRRQQQFGDVLRHGPEQLPDSGRSAGYCWLTAPYSIRRTPSVDAFNRSHAVLLGELERMAAQTRSAATIRPHPAQFKIKEYDRLQPQCPGRLRRRHGDPEPPDDRVRGTLGIHFPDYLPYRRRRSPQSQCPGLFPTIEAACQAV